MTVFRVHPLHLVHTPVAREQTGQYFLHPDRREDAHVVAVINNSGLEFRVETRDGHAGREATPFISGIRTTVQFTIRVPDTSTEARPSQA
jgi:hypothetical protein